MTTEAALKRTTASRKNDKIHFTETYEKGAGVCLVTCTGDRLVSPLIVMCVSAALRQPPSSAFRHAKCRESEQMHVMLYYRSGWWEGRVMFRGWVCGGGVVLAGARW